MATDYIMRVIEQVAAMLAGIMARRKAGDQAGAAQELEEQSLRQVGLPLFVVKHSPPEAVTALLAESGARRHVRGVLLSELLLQDAALAEERGNPPEAVASYALAFRLLNDALATLAVDDEVIYRDRLGEISAKLRDLGGDRSS